MQCPACGSRIWMGAGVAGGYCDEACAENGPLWRMSLRIAPTLVDAEVARLRAAPCERCQRASPIEAHVAYGEDKVHTHVCCKRCGARAQCEAIGEVASAALEHFPVSLFEVLRAIPMNLCGLMIRFRTRTPSAALRQAAAERIAAAQRDLEREARIAELAEAMPRREVQMLIDGHTAVRARELAEAETARTGEGSNPFDDASRR
jgi:hypothetical protein